MAGSVKSMRKGMRKTPKKSCKKKKGYWSK